MSLFDEAYLLAKEKILNAQNIALITHINPDGDCLGSATALRELIFRLGKNAKIFNENGCPQSLCVFDYDYNVLQEKTESEIFDLVICVDCGSIDRAGKVKPVFDGCRFTINIDHHGTNTMFADINIVDETASATGLLIYDFFKACNIEIDRTVAGLLYMAIMMDSGNFSYSNTNKRTHIVAGELLEIGIDVASITQRLLRATTYNRLKLTEKVLGTLTMYCDGQIAVMHATKAMYAATNTDTSDSEGFVGLARDISGVKLAVMLRDTTDGKLVKVSLRSNCDIDVSKIAEEFGGGGHFSAAGCSIEGKIPDAEKIIVERLARVVS